jgi:hypothetical protein
MKTADERPEGPVGEEARLGADPAGRGRWVLRENRRSVMAMMPPR